MDTDVLVYGATSGGVIAAVAAARHGAKVVLLTANGGGTGGEDHIGGMSSSGLGHTDISRPDEVIGGIAREFYLRNTHFYGGSANKPIYNLGKCKPFVTIPRQKVTHLIVVCCALPRTPRRPFSV